MKEADVERIELRLMSDAAFTEEFDVVVDEIVSLYLSDHFKGEEKDRVEQYFLQSPDRQQKVQFMVELLGGISDERSQEPVSPASRVVVPPSAGLFARVRSWWRRGSPSIRVATTFATLVIIAGVAFWWSSRDLNEPAYASVELAMNTADRSTGSQLQTINLSGKDKLRIKLKLPGDAPQVNTFRVHLRGATVSRELSVQQQDSNSLLVEVPANELTRGSYAIELTGVIGNNTELPLRGAYLFTVQ